MKPKEPCHPSAIISFIPVIALVGFLIAVVKIFNTNALEGANQVVLLTASGVCVAIAMLGYHVPWHAFEDAITNNFSSVGTAIIMLLLIGAIGGTWMLSGVVSTMIYYGLKILSPKIFLFACCIICAVVSLITGSSWTTIATIGVALIGIGQSQGIAAPWIAGSIISGAYFGDKISPLSDTTVLASSSAGTPLFTHIRYMLITTTPSLVIALLVFSHCRFFHGRSGRTRHCILQHCIDKLFSYQHLALADSRHHLDPNRFQAPSPRYPVHRCSYGSPHLAVQPAPYHPVFDRHPRTTGISCNLQRHSHQLLWKHTDKHFQPDAHRACRNARHGWHDEHRLADYLRHVFWRRHGEQWHDCQHHETHHEVHPALFQLGCLHCFDRRVLQHLPQRPIPLHTTDQ